MSKAQTMNKLRDVFLCLLCFDLVPLFGQTLVGAGYSDPSLIRVAPGQITTLFVTGLKTVLSNQQVKATTVPLPTALAGISVTLNQSGFQPSPVPLFAIQQIPVCNNGAAPPPATALTPDCFMTAITVQIPFELSLRNGDSTAPAGAELVVSENGNVSRAFAVSPVADDLHVLKTCDVFPSPKVIRVSQPATSAAPLCASVVTHGNGDLITADDPARPGEEIVVWAFGLGASSPAVKTGAATPAPAPVLSGRRGVRAYG